MLIYKGKYNTAKVFIDVLDETTVSQIYNFLNHPAFEHGKIRIMPDTHAGAGAVIGFTMQMNNYVIPNVVGVDIGCGMSMVEIKDPINLDSFDAFIKKNIPSGFSTHDQNGKKRNMLEVNYGVIDHVEALARKIGHKDNVAVSSLGTLGGGNHFIEIDEYDGRYFLVVHTGSRNFGLSVCNYHQNRAKALMRTMFHGADAYKGLEFLPFEFGGEEYIKDMHIAQFYASENRRLIISRIMTDFFHKDPVRVNRHGAVEYDGYVECIHNYINIDDMIIRKGAISAKEGEKVIIPLNMRDGVIIGTGKGNSDWNFSAPHGAGRILSRKKAKETISIDEFKASMEGIYTSCVNNSTLDESPMAYKDKNLIIDAIKETVDIDFIMKPVYNFKAGGE